MSWKLACVIAGLFLAVTPALGVATVVITSPQDQQHVNPGGGGLDPVDVTYQITGNTCIGFRSSYSVTPYVNGVAVSCAGSGCSCDGTTEACNNVTKTITLDGNDFNSCLNTIQIALDPAPFAPPGCIVPGPDVFSNTIQVWQSTYKECTGCTDCNRSSVGRPVDVASGEMYHDMVDLRIAGPLPMEFRRRYNSRSTFNGAMGFGWQHAYQIRLEAAGTNREVLIDERGRRIYFAKNGQGAWDENRIEHLVLTAPGSPVWRVTDKHQRKLEFDAAGKLTRIADRNGNQLTFSYSGTNLTTITDDFGRSMSLTYSGSRVQTASAGGRTATYTYNGTTSNLELIQWSDGSFVDYQYTDTDSHNMTAALDSNGHLIEGHSYYGTDQVHTTQADGGNYLYTLVYDSPTQTTVTNSRSVPTVYIHSSFNGLVTSSTGPGCASCGSGGISATREYDRFLNLTKVEDALVPPVVTQMTYDAKGNLLTRTEALGTPRARTTTYTYDPTFNLPATVTVPSVGSGACLSAHPNKIVTNTYRTTPAPNGDLMQRKIEGCEGVTFFTNITTYDYDSHGQLSTANGPRSMVPDDVTTYSYYADAAPDPNDRARLQTVTNALGHQTTYADYDLFGNVGTVTQANSPADVVTTYLYDDKDRPTEIRIKGAIAADDIVTENHYDLEGNLDFVRLPNCVEAGLACAFTEDYVYDGVNRVQEVHDAVGNKVVYTYDTEGSRTREEYRDTTTAQRYTNFEYDSFNRLHRICHGAPTPGVCGSVFSEINYFDDGTRQAEQDPLGHTTTFTYDELKRLKTATQSVPPDTLTTTYSYDVQDNLTSITDPRGLVTTYTNSDLGWRLLVTSPDTGGSAYGYDSAGNLVTSTNANGVTSTRTHDALNRVLTVTYTDASLNVTQSYDSAAVSFGVGRRTSMTDPSGTSIYNYDRRGLLTAEQKSVSGVTYTTQYSFDKTGNLKQVLYPSPEVTVHQGQVDFTYDDANRVSLVTTKLNGATTPVASSLAYKPFGPRTQLTFGNGLPDVRTYGTRYQLGTWTLGSSPTFTLNYSHSFNDDLDLFTRTDNNSAANNRTFAYDEAHRLKAAAGPWGSGTACGGVSYTYDRNGNRQCVGEVSPATNYTYVPNTNQLTSTNDGVNIATFAHDNNGNITSDSAHTYGYSQADRLASIDAGATATYTYDGDGRRASKTLFGLKVLYFYDSTGKLLTETTGIPGSGTDYLYLDHVPLGRVDWSVNEFDLGNVLRVNKNASNARLDWSLVAPDAQTYAVRRKQVVNPNDRTFNGNAIIARFSDGTRIYDDPVLGDANRYDYRVLRQVVAEALFFYHADHLGTPIAMTHGTSAAVVWRAEHRPFGSLHSLPVGVVTNNLRFSGQYFDSETGLHQNWHRDYSPITARYYQSDPLGLESGDFATYVYAASNPISVDDPQGLVASICCRLLASRFFGSTLRQRHCYAVADDGTRYGLYPEMRNGRRLGVPRTNDPRDHGGTCADCTQPPLIPVCDQDRCFRDQFTRYPVGEYRNLGPNSNTFAAALARRCCMNGLPAGLGSAPGTDDRPPAPVP